MLLTPGALPRRRPLPSTLFLLAVGTMGGRQVIAALQGLATAHLDAINRLSGPQPWPLSFSFARALQAAPLKTWGGDQQKVADAQRAFHHRARCNSAARRGAYTPELERSAA